MRRMCSIVVALALAVVLAVPALAAGGVWDAAAHSEQNLEEVGGTYYGGQGNSGRYIIRQRSGDSSASGLAISTNGSTWKSIPRKMTEDMMRLTETGRAVLYYCTYTGQLWYWDETDWAEAELPAVATSMSVTYKACWTGDGYLLNQTAVGIGMMGFNAGETGMYNNKVLLLDEHFQVVGEHDFGAQVEGLSYTGGACYVQAGGVIYKSTDRTNWTAAALSELPQAAPQTGGSIRTCAVGDESDGTLVYRQAGGKLLVSCDGVYFMTLRDWKSAGVKVCGGQTGSVLTGEEYGEIQVIDHVALKARWTAKFGQPIYVTLDGTYLTTTDLGFYQRSGCTMVPLRQLATAAGYTFSYDSASQSAVCTSGGVSATITLGKTAAQVTGRGTVSMSVPPELKGGIFYVPVRFWSGITGGVDTFDAASNTIEITSG